MSTSDIIYLRELKIETAIGVHAWEQQIKQTITLDIEITFDIRKAAQSGLVQDTIDYSEMAQKIVAYVSNKTFTLLETLVENIANLLLQEYPTNHVCLRANKLAAVPNVKEVGVRIERTKLS